MEKKRILEDGLLEQYLTGELSSELHDLVEKALQEDADLKAQFDALEEDFQRMGLEQAITPPEHVRTNLQKRLEQTERRKLNWFPLSIAAGLALIFALSAFWLYGRWQNAENKLNSLQSQTTELQKRIETLESDYQLTSTHLESINNVDVVPLVLYGNHRAPNAKAVAYINHKSKLVIINPKGLPSLPENKTYQMWSDVEGVMIDMGTLSTDEELITLKYIDNAESLNITIEPVGGNDHPTVEQLVSYLSI
ncbi:anti-sigma factor [Flagellimonas allohymeniacidonis]|uniref:Anti-sigma factor n=1 Tax=Flagellimonas allohymeniacidonis TaxID=2517819 RepID=A0A4Q8QEC4_9FLAO|nr:anti-sigma factor [Allomuricauda hymeniacidonis]TAI46639.1 anti-sigma factor [Allomuricauda hymeniacidonis]